MKETYECRLVSKREPVPGIFDFTVECPQIAAAAHAGQFLHIECGGKTLLRRPISICDAGESRVRFIFEVKGAGTELLAKKNAGDSINILGPLGNGFWKTAAEKPVIIGGGIGVFPLYMLAKLLPQSEIMLGFRSADRVVMEEEFRAVSERVTVCTDDGSYGEPGFAAEVLKKRIAEGECDAVYACGPSMMLKIVKQIAENAGIPCQLSLEQRMGCGIGACLVCTCETIFEGTDRQKRVCKDGPVFESTEVTLNA